MRANYETKVKPGTMGVTPWEWQKYMTINDETGEVVFHDA